MVKTLRSVGILIALMLLTTGVSWAATYTENEELSIPAASGLHLIVDSENGEITVRPWSGSDILVTATKSVSAWTSGRARNVADTIRIEVAQTWDTVRIRAAFRHYFFVRQKVSYDILVPADWIGQVELITSNGAISAEGVNGDVHLHTSNGRINVDGHAGRLTVRTSNGSVEVRDVDTVLYARSSNGRITIHDAVLRGTGEIRTSNGRITLQGAFHGGADPKSALRTAMSNCDCGILLIWRWT